MPIKFRCEHCRQLLGISQTKAGEMVDCPTCGRAVRVPSLDGKSGPISIPKWDHKDQSLVNALNALASLTGEPGLCETPGPSAGSEESLATGEKDSRVHPPRQSVPVPKVTALPEPIEMPPLEAPVVIPEETKPSNPPATAAVVIPENGPDPWSKLATLSDASPSSAATRDGRSHAPSISASQSGKGVTLPIALLLVAMAFLLGYFVGHSRSDFTSPADPNLAEMNQENETKADEKVDPAPSTRRRAVEGRITYLSAAGSSQSDTGAVVILLPAYRNSSTRLPIVGFRPADSADDRELAKAMVTALGGDLSIVDDRGMYSCDLPQAGEYHLIVLSRHLERSETEPLEASVRTMLGQYFDRPQQLVGDLKYHVSEVTYRGEVTEIHDHAFGREI